MTHPARTYRLMASVIAGLLIAAVCAARAQAPGWQTYSYPSDGFSVSYPSQPQLSSKDISTDAGPFELRSYIVEAGDVALFVGVCDYGNKTDGRNPDEVLQGAKNGALANSKSHLVGERRITLSIYAGLAFESESDDAHFTARIYMVGSTLYQTLVVNPIGKPYSDTQRFLDSFQLIARDRS